MGKKAQELTIGELIEKLIEAGQPFYLGFRPADGGKEGPFLAACMAGEHTEYGANPVTVVLAALAVAREREAQEFTRKQAEVAAMGERFKNIDRMFPALAVHMTDQKRLSPAELLRAFAAESLGVSRTAVKVGGEPPEPKVKKEN